MERRLFYFFIAIFSFVMSLPLYAETVVEKKSSVGVSPSIGNKKLQPIKANSSLDRDKVTYDFTLSNLSLGAPSSSGDRTCSVTVRNNTDHAIPTGRYFFRYWHRESSSTRWNPYYGGAYSYSFAPGQAQVVPFHLGIPEGGTQFRVTMHFDSATGLSLAEISKAVE